jgi:hypothetical protein
MVHDLLDLSKQLLAGDQQGVLKLQLNFKQLRLKIEDLGLKFSLHVEVGLDGSVGELSPLFFDFAVGVFLDLLVCFDK